MLKGSINLNQTSMWKSVVTMIVYNFQIISWANYFPRSLFAGVLAVALHLVTCSWEFAVFRWEVGNHKLQQLPGKSGAKWAGVVLLVYFCLLAGCISDQLYLAKYVFLFYIIDPQEYALCLKHWCNWKYQLIRTTVCLRTMRGVGVRFVTLLWQLLLIHWSGISRHRIKQNLCAQRRTGMWNLKTKLRNSWFLCRVFWSPGRSKDLNVWRFLEALVFVRVLVHFILELSIDGSFLIFGNITVKDSEFFVQFSSHSFLQNPSCWLQDFGFFIFWCLFSSSLFKSRIF